MSAYPDLVRKHRRLAILRYLAECADYTSNASILQSVLAGVGVASSRDQVVTEVVWLADQGFATFEDREQFVVVTATGAGVEIA